MTGVLDLEMLVRVPWINPDTGYDVSPDGKVVAFSWNKSGTWEIYLLSLEHLGEARQLTSGSGAKFHPVFSPDGKQLAFVQDDDGSEAYDLYLMGLDSGEARNLTPDTPFAIQLNFSWSPDGKWIAYASDELGRFDLYVLEVEAGEKRLLAELGYPVWDITWAPSGGWIAVEVDGGGQDAWAYLVAATGDTIQRVEFDGKVVCARQLCWSLDGNSLVFASNHRGNHELAIYELATASVKWLTLGHGEKEYPAWSQSSALIAHIRSDGPDTHLQILNLESGQVQAYQVASGIHYKPIFKTDNSLVLAFDSPGRPDDLWRFDLGSKVFEQLTFSMPESLAQARFAMPEHLYYQSYDEEEVPALLYLPPGGGGQDRPAVVYIHGGPNWLFQYMWDPFVQHMVSRGWVVIAPNYRGSTGYGREWQLKNRFDLGGGDTEDVAAAADFLVREKLADPNRIGITGRSWGGYLTMTCLTRYSEKWAAGSAVVPFLNWFTAHENSREDLKHWDLENFGNPDENHDLWHAHSPYFFLDQVKAPVQLICGENDPRCPASESKQAYEKLVGLGVPCDLVLYKDEGHGYHLVDNAVDAKRRGIDFLASYLEKNM